MISTTTRFTRVLEWEGCANVRDLGHLGADSRTRYASIVRADDLSRLTSAGREQAARHGIRTVIDLRAPDEGAPLRDDRFEILERSRVATSTSGRGPAWYVPAPELETLDKSL